LSHLPNGAFDARIAAVIEQQCDAGASPIYAQKKEASRMADEVILGYCVKEKAQKPMKDPQEVTLKNGKHAIRGVCASCGTKMMKFVSAKKADPAAPAAASTPAAPSAPPPTKTA
jgi:hypothetical protein